MNYWRSISFSRQLKINMKSICVFSFIFIMFGLKVNAQVSSPQKKLDSILVVNQKYLKADTNKLNLLTKIYRLYMNLRNFDKSEEYVDKTVQMAHKLNQLSYSGRAYNKLALLYHGFTNFQKAEENYQKSIQEYYLINDQDNVAGIYLNMGALYSSIPDYAKALEMNQKAITIFQKTNNEDDLANCFANISGIYQDLGQQNKSLEYMRKALKIFMKAGEYSRGVAIAYEGIGMSYLKATPTELINMDILPDQKLIVSLGHLNHALNISEKLDDSNMIGHIKKNIGFVYERMGSKDLALKSYQKSIEINKNSDDKRGYAESLQAFGSFYQNQKDNVNAVKLLSQALSIAEQNKLLDLQRDANLSLSNAYDKLKKFDESLTFYKKYVVVKDEIFNEEKEKEITRRQMQIDFGVKEKDYQLRQQITDGILKEQVFLAKQQHQKLILRQQQLALSDKEKSLQRLKFLKKQADLENEKKLQNSDFQRASLEAKYEAATRDKRITKQEQQIKFDGKVKIFLLVAFTLVLFTAGLIYFNQRKTTRLNKIINQQKRELEQLSRVKDRIFSVVSHDMRTPVNSLMSFIQLLEEGTIEQDKLSRYAASLKNNLTYTSSMMENLLNWAASQMQGFNPYLEALEVNPVINDVIDSLKDSANSKGVTVQNNICPSTFCKADMNMFSLVLRNLISNSIKFTPQNGLITLNCATENQGVQILISDNGIGMSEEQVNHFNKPGYQGAGVSTLGTNKEKGTGLGLLLCRTFMSLMDSHITVQSEKSKGSQFTLWLKPA
jgi:signal transduction histidine kinase